MDLQFPRHIVEKYSNIKSDVILTVHLR